MIGIRIFFQPQNALHTELDKEKITIDEIGGIGEGDDLTDELSKLRVSSFPFEPLPLSPSVSQTRSVRPSIRPSFPLSSGNRGEGSSLEFLWVSF